MKSRKLKRKNIKHKRKSAKQVLHIRPRADKAALAATKGEEYVDYVGNFIFFATSGGDAWMLDHRHSYALRLANNHQIQPYGINETHDKFQVEWKERYAIEDDVFIASLKGKAERFEDYPINTIQGLINLIRLKEKQKTSPIS